MRCPEARKGHSANASREQTEGRRSSSPRMPATEENNQLRDRCSGCEPANRVCAMVRRQYVVRMRRKRRANAAGSRAP
ncbi:hypothetical protein NDU88_005373 [Pleurodeles waltl]|uniref:4Fe-4S Wbl-type domain-containing protein n=1 Tax=Pleurodeles waltl TaxID=8319 RepID=A0AAV7TAA8_PLEWA|nr:hypothetical protein NDU88_005373 [Pleurodeles waltl]